MSEQELIMFLRCRLCGQSKPEGKSLEEYSRLSVALTKNRETLKVFCVRHKVVVGVFDLDQPMTAPCDCCKPKGEDYVH